MKLNFGRVQRYDLVRGFGFVSCTFETSPRSTQGVFFHIKEIKKKYPNLAQELDQGSYQNISFWYRSESGNKGEQVSDIWLDIKDIPLPLIELAELVLTKVKLIDVQHRSALLEELSSKTEEIFLVSSDLRDLLNLNSYCRFVNKHLNMIDHNLNQELINELVKRVQESSDSLRSEYWEQASYLHKNLKYKGALWSIAPQAVKINLIKQRHSKFFNIISQFDTSEYPFSETLSMSWKAIYNFSDLDNKLIKQWCPDFQKQPFEAAKMISARGAEKLVIEFYKSCNYLCNYLVEDISIHQVTGESISWKQADIRLDSERLIDVKNARTSVNSNTYSEFCIPRFKQERGNDVRVVAVMSPYLQKEYMNGTKEPKFYVGNPIILGGLNKNELSSLETLFSDRLLSIDIVRELDPKTYLPPWLFDYDNDFYVRQIETLANFQQLDDSEIPDWENIVIANIKPFPVFISSRRKLPVVWIKNLSKWEAAFINSLINLPVKNVSLPHLFLSLLKHFLMMLSYNDSEYEPYQYLKLLYGDLGEVHPLKLYDPLNIIKDFCDTLQTLWEHREQANLSEFKVFKFTGKGLLRGWKSQPGNPTTLLAYCGGKVEQKGKCGYSPLVIGKDKNCSSCGCLICPKENCQYCNKNCKLFLERRSELLRSKRTYNFDDYF